MKVLTKVICIIFIVVSLALIVSCNSNKEVKNEKFTEKKIILGFSQMGAECEWRSAYTKSIEEAVKKEGIELIINDAKQNKQNQLKSIRNFIMQKVDVIAFTPVFQDGWEPVLREAHNANIPVILMNGSINADSSLYTSLIGTDYYNEGSKSAEWLISYCKKIGLFENIGIVELQGTAGSTAAIYRSKGFNDLINQNTNFKIIDSRSGDFTKAKGKEVMESIIKDNGSQIKVVFAHNDDMAIGAIEALEANNFKPGKDIIIVSIDAAKGAFNAMINGKMNCSIESNPLVGTVLAKMVKSIYYGGSVEKKVFLENHVFPANEAKKFLPNRKY